MIVRSHWKIANTGNQSLRVPWYHHYAKHPWTAWMQTRKKRSSLKQETARILLTQRNMFTTKPRFVKVLITMGKKLLVNKVGLEALSDYLSMPEECSISVMKQNLNDVRGCIPLISIAPLPSICTCLMTTTWARVIHQIPTTSTVETATATETTGMATASKTNHHDDSDDGIDNRSFRYLNLCDNCNGSITYF